MDKRKPLKQPSKKANSHQPIAISRQRDYSILLLCIAIAFISFVRYRLITIPFERDEGEYGYIGSLILRGIAPFNGAYSMKLPGTSFMYAVLMSIFGHTSTGVHFGMIFINAATMFFLYTAFKKIFTPFIGLSTASIYGFMAISMPFEGFSAHATHFICFYSAIALLFLADFIKSGKLLNLFLCGLMLGMVLLMKQQALFLIIFGAAFLFIYLKTEKKQAFAEIIKKLSIFGLGVVLPFTIVVLIIVYAGQFKTFWLWTVEYASKYETISKAPGEVKLAFNSTFSPAWDTFYYLWLLALAGILALWWSPYTRLQKIFAIGYVVASICVFSSGFYFRQHYYIVILPAIGLLSGMFIEFVIKQTKGRLSIMKPLNIALLVLSAILLFNVYDNRQYYFHYTPRNFTYGENPFNQAEEIAKYIKNNSKDTDKIAVLGSEPEIYFYANRMAATGFLYTYPLVENQPYNELMQDQMIQEIEKNKPVFFLFCNISTSWLVRPGSPNKIFTWGREYATKYYTPVSFADFFGDAGWKMYLGDDLKNGTNKAQSFIILFKRKPDN